MELNPFDKQLEDARKRASELRFKRKSTTDEIDWYNRTELKILTKIHEELQGRLNDQTQVCDRLRSEIQQIEGSINELSNSLKSLWSFTTLFDSEQWKLRGHILEKKTLLENVKKKASTAEDHLQKLRMQSRSKIEEIEKFKSFDLDAKHEERLILENQLSQQEKKIYQIEVKKQQVDAELAPIVKQIRDAQQKKTEANFNIFHAKSLDTQLGMAVNSRERAIVHRKCEDKFGTGSPRRVISQNESQIRKLDRDIQKLEKRAKTVAEKAARNIRKLILDGNNLCYQGDKFIGLDALKSLVSVLAYDYEVVLVFDASIRRAIGSGDSDIRDILGSDIDVHIVATSIKADEIILDLAGSDQTTFIVSNDRFSEFGEKQALRDRRIIRHEIVAGQVLIHDLGVSETFTE